jgi:hypothetical protein
MTRKKLVSTIIAIAVSAVFLWLAFSRINFSDLMAAFRTIQWWVRSTGGRSGGAFSCRPRIN